MGATFRFGGLTMNRKMICAAMVACAMGLSGSWSIAAEPDSQPVPTTNPSTQPVPATQASTLPATTQAADEVLKSFAMPLSESHKLPLATADQYTLSIKFERTEYLPFEPMEWTKTFTCGSNGKPYVIADTKGSGSPTFLIRRMDQPDWHSVGPSFSIGMGPTRLVSLKPGDSFSTDAYWSDLGANKRPLFEPGHQYLLRQSWEVNGLIVRSNEVTLTIKDDENERAAFQDLLADKPMPATTALIRELDLKTKTRDPFIIRQCWHLQQFIDKHPDSQYSDYLRARYVMLVEDEQARSITHRVDKTLVAQAADYKSYLLTHIPWIMEYVK